MNFRKKRHPARPRILFIAAACVLMPGCAGGPSPAPALRPVYLTDVKAVSLLPTRALDRAIETRQLMEGRYRDRTYSLEAWVKAGPEEIAMVGLTGFGTEVYRLTYRDAGIEFTAVPFAGAMRAEYLVADFQLCYFPAEAVASMLDAAGLAFRETKTADGWSREIRDGEDLIIAVVRRGRTIEYDNRLRGYGYTIHEAEEEEP